MITEHRVPELILVLDSQPAGDVSHKPGGRLPCWWRGTVVERRSLAGELSLSCARPAADG